VTEEFELAEPPVRTVVLESADGVRVELIERSGAARAAVFGDPPDTLRGLGAEAVWPPAAAVQPGARFAYVKDPEGNLIELIQPAAASGERDRAGSGGICPY